MIEFWLPYIRPCPNFGYHTLDLVQISVAIHWTLSRFWLPYIGPYPNFGHGPSPIDERFRLLDPIQCAINVGRHVDKGLQLKISCDLLNMN